LVFLLRWKSNTGLFLLEYPGPLLTAEEGSKREEQYESEKLGSYLYFFKCKDGSKMCVDATHEVRYGKFVNDSLASLANCQMKQVDLDTGPRLCLFATRDIIAGTELRLFFN